jgi:methyl-accepting chemotaxis protein PixJ
MTVTPTNPLVKDSNLSTKNRFFSRIQSLMSKQPIETIGVSLLLSIILFGFSGLNIWNTYKGFRETIVKNFNLQKLSDRTTYLDEVLTMSVYMGTSSGNLEWVKRYQTYEPELTKVIEELIAIDPTIAVDFDQTKTANDKLVEYETRAIEFLRQGKKQEADKLLFGKDYTEQKQIYAQGVEKTIARIQANIDRQLTTYESSLLWSVIAAGVSLPLIILTWVLALSAVKTYIRDRDNAQKSLSNSQLSLQKLNSSLEQQAQQLESQELQTKQENEIFQTDVGNLLNVVLAVEDGDLTIQAPVSDRVTGLVSDSFNRLVEQLARIMATVSSTTQQVTQNASNVEQLAIQTEQQVQQQTQSVAAVQALVQSINDLTQDNARQTQNANEFVQQAQESVLRGQQQMTQLNQEVDTLGQGADLINKRVQNLNDFVQLAVQFAKDQRRISSMTRVLSLNASLLSTRATEQQDPEQFASIAREFETIATQVNDLAVQTSQSLIVLQQRTDQIQTVVSGLNQDAQEINQIIKDFTAGTAQSRQVFDEIRLATEKVAQVEEQVAQSSMAIAKTVDTTLKSIQEISTLASDTEKQANLTREQSVAMEKVARELYEMVRFFRIAPEQMQNDSTSKSLQPVSTNGKHNYEELPNSTDRKVVR